MIQPEMAPASAGAGRSAIDVLSRSLRLTLGGQEYVLAVLFIAGNERWRALEESTSAQLVAELDDADDDGRKVMAAFTRQVDIQLDLLYAYDTDFGRRPGALPDREELKERIYEDELETALGEVVKAANPKAVTAVQRMVVQMTNGSSPPSSSSPPSTAGRQKRSAKH